MKLIRAEFKNFRLLRDLNLEFSTDSKKKLTVIRAENETGKTTILNGLQWALCGDDGLPGKGKDYRLHPIDWEASDGERVPISAQVDFEITKFRPSSRGLIENKRQYRIIRSAYETVADSGQNRTQSIVKLFHLTDRGSEPIEPPEALIHEELPPELREVFFTDGDRALNFIEAEGKDRRDRVKEAIRSLLGIGVIEDAINHVGKTTSAINKTVKAIVTDDKHSSILARLEQVEKESEGLEEKIKDSKAQVATFEEKIADLQKEIDMALVRGNQQELKTEIEQIKRQLKHIENEQTDAGKEHSNLFRSLLLSRDLLAPILKKSFGKLNELRAQGKIPNTTIPVLEERLKATTCICGESLDPHSVDGGHRRRHIQCLIDESRKADALQNSITDLYYSSSSLNLDNEDWIAEYDKIEDRRARLESIHNEQGKKLKALEVRLDSIPNVDIQGLRSTQRYYKNQRDRFNDDRIRDETLLEGLRRERGSLILQRDNLLREEKKGAFIRARLDVARDVEGVLKAAYDRMTNEELTKVSELMNTIFLEMIGADPDQGAIIRKAQISKDFDILVYGPNDRLLDPNRDLNGASRRALTLAFILALSKVSGAEAPNVIDTPLGMMSGYVKRSVLKTAIRESFQLVLFLTRSEIADCEEILDAEAGRVITLTNPAHYPRMLVSDPQVKERKVLRCECNHRQECKLCQRQMDVEETIELKS